MIGRNRGDQDPITKALALTAAWVSVIEDCTPINPSIRLDSWFERLAAQLQTVDDGQAVPVALAPILTHLLARHTPSQSRRQPRSSQDGHALVEPGVEERGATVTVLRARPPNCDSLGCSRQMTVSPMSTPFTRRTKGLACRR